MDLVLDEIKMKPVSLKKLKKVEKTKVGLISAEQLGGVETLVKPVLNKKSVKNLLTDMVDDVAYVASKNTSRGTERRAKKSVGMLTKVQMPPNSRADAGKKHKKSENQAMKEALGAKQFEDGRAKRTYNTRSKKNKK